MDIFEEYNQLNDDMHELQAELEDAGFFDQEGENEDGNSKTSLFQKMGGGKRIKGMLQKTKTVLKIGPTVEEKREMDEIQRKMEEAEAEFNRQQDLKEEEELRKLHQPALDDSDKPVEKIQISTKATLSVALEAPSPTPVSGAEVPVGEKKDIKEILQGINKDKEQEEKDKKDKKDKKEKRDKKAEEENKKL